MTDTTQIEAFAALNHIENGDWDRFLLRLRGAIELRRATDEYEQHIVVGPVIPRPEGRSVRPRPTAPAAIHPDDARTAVDGLWEMTRKAAALERERDQALYELERLRNTLCFECGHS